MVLRTLITDLVPLLGRDGWMVFMVSEGIFNNAELFLGLGLEYFFLLKGLLSRRYSVIIESIESNFMMDYLVSFLCCYILTISI